VFVRTLDETILLYMLEKSTSSRRSRRL